jgi:hypothetical protein
MGSFILVRDPNMAELMERAASLGDFKDIWGLMGRVAAEVPFDFDSEAEQESILSELMACCISGLSPIVVGEDKSIIGALLVRRDDFDWGFRTVRRCMFPTPRSHRATGTKVFCRRS